MRRGSSPLFVLLRNLGLILMGAFFGILLDGIGGHSLRPAGALLGGLAGVVLASEWQRLPTLRVRWLLGRLRLILTAAGGALLALTALLLLRYGTVWPLIGGYGVLTLRYPGLGTLLWEALLLAVGIGGALGGLWVVDGVGLRWPQARRLFLGLQGLLLAVTLPIYMLSAFLLRFAPLPPLVNWTALLLVMTTAVAVAWGLREHRRQVELVLKQARGGWAQGAAQLPSLRASWMNRARAWLQTNTPNGVLRAGATMRRPLGRIKLPAVRLEPRWNPPTLTEMETASTWPLLLTATVTAVILQRIAATLLTGVVVGLGLLAFYILLILAGLVGLGLLIRYLKNRP